MEQKVVSRMVNYTMINSGKENRLALLKGAMKLAEVVVETLGPGGRTVILDDVATKDGVSVALRISHLDPIENAGAQILKQVAKGAQEKAGDGTTTATLLAFEIFKSLVDVVRDGINPSSVKEGMEKALKDIEAHVSRDVIAVDPLSDEGMAILRHVAHIASNNDHMVADLIAQAVRASKGTNPIKIEMARERHCFVESYEGMVYYNKVLSPLFLDNMDSPGELHLKNARVFITDFDIMHIMDVQAALNYYVDRAQKGENPELVIVANEISEEALRSITANMVKYRQQGLIMKVVAIKAPGMGQEQQDQLRDMALFMGAVPVLKSDFVSISDLGEQDIDDILGTCEVKIKRDQYSIIRGMYDKTAFDAKIKYLGEMIEEEESGYTRERLAERKAKLLGNIAVIFVGAESEIEAKEIRDRVDDAVNAIKGALEEGVVKGGGVALLLAANEVLKLFSKDRTPRPIGYKEGYMSVINACVQPFSTIVTNADMDPKAALNVLMESLGERMVDIMTGNEVDIIKAKIFDPKKVTVSALRSAVSVASVLMSTNTTVIGYSGPSNQ